jgi:hypothetical protein
MCRIILPVSLGHLHARPFALYFEMLVFIYQTKMNDYLKNKSVNVFSK